MAHGARLHRGCHPGACRGLFGTPQKAEGPPEGSPPRETVDRAVRVSDPDASTADDHVHVVDGEVQFAATRLRSLYRR